MSTEPAPLYLGFDLSTQQLKGEYPVVCILSCIMIAWDFRIRTEPKLSPVPLTCPLFPSLHLYH